MNVLQKNFVMDDFFIKTYDDVVSEEFCASVIKTFEVDETSQHRLDRNGRPNLTRLDVTQQYLHRKERWLHIHKKLQDTFLDYIQRYQEDYNVIEDFPRTYSVEEFNIKRYNIGDEFADHVDSVDLASAQRFLAFFLYLNDVEEGGETVFPKLGLTVEPRRGKLLMFPPFWMYRHAGRPVIRGKKYITGSYLHYR